MSRHGSQGKAHRMIYEAREGKANERTNGDERLLRRAYTTRERNRARGTGMVWRTVNLAAIDTCEMRRSATRGLDALTPTPRTYAQRRREKAAS